MVRLSALANALVDLGADVELVTRMENPPTGSFRVPEQISPTDESAWYLGFRRSSAVVVLDLYEPDSNQIAAWRAQAELVCLIDDVGDDVPADVDLVVAPALAAPSLGRPQSTYLRGAPYVLLRPGFAGAARAAASATVASVFVCLGGSDPLNLTPHVVAWLLDLPGEVVVVAALGGGFEPRGEMEALALRHPRLQLHVSSSDVGTLMAGADIGVVGAGTLAYESAAVGLPSILVSINEAQAKEANVLEEAGTGAHIPIERLDASSLQSSVSSLQPKEVRAHMSRAGRQLIDGLGARRVAARIAELWHERQGKML